MLSSYKSGWLAALFGLFLAICFSQNQHVHSLPVSSQPKSNSSISKADLEKSPSTSVIPSANSTNSISTNETQLLIQPNVTIIGAARGGLVKSGPGAVQSKIIIMNSNNFFAAFMATVNFISWCTQTYEYVMWLVSVLARSDSEKQKNYREAAEELNRIEGILDQMTLNNIHNHVYMRDNVAPHEDEIRRSAINAIEYLESPNSTVAKDEFLNGAKLLEDSIIRIFERLLNQSVSGPSYLDSLRDSTKCHRRQVVNSLQGVMQLLSLGAGTLPLYFKESNMPIVDQTRKKNRLDKYQQEAILKINTVENECIKEGRVPNEITEMVNQNAAISNRDLAEILYDYLSDKYDTKHWLVVVYNAISGDINHKIALNSESNNCQWIGAQGNKNVIVCSQNSICRWDQTSMLATEDKINDYFNHYYPRPDVAMSEIKSLKLVPDTSMMAVIQTSAEVEIATSKEMCFFAQNYGSKTNRPGGLTTIGIPFRNNTSASPTYFAIQGYGKVMQISQAAITVVEPTWNAGRVKPADNQLWYQDENGIRAKSNGYCLYSTGDDGRFRTDKCDKQKWMLRDNKISDMYNPKNCASITYWNTPTRTQSTFPPTFPMVETQCNNHTNQEWTIIKEPTYFAIKSKMHGKVMDVSNDPKSYGTINMWDQLHVGIQLWFLDDNGVIRAKATGYCIFSKGYYSGGFVTMPCDQTDNQRWARRNNQIVNLNQPSNCMDIFHAEKQDGARVIEYTCSSTINMQWEFDFHW